MKIGRLIVLLSLFFSLVNEGVAQKDFMKDADAAFNNESYYTAADLYKKAQAKAKPAEKAKIFYLIGECYNNMLDAAQAETYYKKAIQLKYEKTDPGVLYNLAGVYKRQGDYKSAKEYYEKYLAAKPGDKDAQAGLESCQKALEWMNEPTRYIIQNEVQLNTTAYDYSPAWGDKKHTQLIFSSSRQGSTGDEVDPRTGQSYMDLWITTRDNTGKWGQPQILPKELINTEDNEGTAIMDSKGKYLFFTRCPRVKKENIGCDIFMSQAQGSSWTKAEKIVLKPEGADTVSCGHPALDRNATLMIFASDLPGGQGGKDLWYTEYNKREKTWGTPVNLGPAINTSGDELFPYLADDGTLYFSSNGHIGMGALDIFKAENTGDKKWENVENLKYPFNSPENDFGILFEKGTTTRGFFSSGREGGKGYDDIWNFNLPEIKFIAEVYVKNKETGDPIPGVSITLTGSDGSQVVKTTDEEGKLVFDEDGGKRYLQKETNYTLEANKDEYLVAKSSFTTVGLDVSKKFIEDIFIQPATKETVIDFPEVQYAYNKSELLVDDRINSKDSLDYLYKTLMENPTIVIELQAHTDCRGSDSYNKKLSQARAQSCVDYLISKGIPADRMVPVGYGEDIPRAVGLECETIAKMPTKEEQEAAHQRNRRTQFRVLSFDYKPAAPEEGQ